MMITITMAEFVVSSVERNDVDEEQTQTMTMTKMVMAAALLSM